MISQPYQAVVFDFDYTLADSSQGIIACVNYALETLGFPPVPPAAILPTVGLALPEMLCVLVGEQARDRASEFSRLFIARADQIMAGMTVIYAQTAPTVAALRAAGLRLGIVTTKFRYRVEAILPPELRMALGVIVGIEDVERPKPDPQGLLAALQRLGVAVEHALYVGDSPTDAATAQRAGVPFVAVLSGATLREAFASYAPLAILAHVGELPAWLARETPAAESLRE
jgi:phosphoglycolate phosphatase